MGCGRSGRKPANRKIRMGFRINTNLSSLGAQRSVTLRNEESGGNFSRLSTGRFSARDDASGLGISERMGSQIRSHSEVIHNTQSGIDYAAQADSQLGEVSTNLARLREIAVEASNGTLSDSDREALQDEFGELIEEIDSIASAEGTSGSIALDGSESIQIQAGIDADSTVSSDTVDVSSSSLGIDSVDLSDSSSASSALSAIHSAIDSVSESRGSLSSFSRGLSQRQSSAVRAHESLSASRSLFSSVDVALESAALIGNKLLQAGSIASLLQANSGSGAALRLLG